MQFIVFAFVIAASASAVSRNQRPTLEDHSTTALNTTILKVIPTTDDQERHEIHRSPPIVLVGNNDGILRCLYEKPKDCEVLYNVYSDIYDIVVSGQDMYAGHLDIVKCNLYDKSCKIFNRVGSFVLSLCVGGGYLYVGLSNHTVLRCGLQQPDSCRPLHTMEDQVYSLIQLDGLIYVGLINGNLMRCSLTAENDCAFMVNVASKPVMVLRNVGEFILEASGGYLCNHSSKLQFTNGSCVQFDSKGARVVAPFDSFLYVLNDNGKVYACKWSNGTSCSDYVQYENVYPTRALSMAFAYGAYHMQSRFNNEDTTCIGQSNAKCPPFVYYYDEQERTRLEVNVRDGKLYNSKGYLVDTCDAEDGLAGPAAIFAMGIDGRLLLSNVHKKGLLEISSLFAGKPVAGAGEMVVKAGVIQLMTACSEHYRPDLALNQQVIQSLRAQGYTDPIDSQLCCYGDCA